MSKKTKELKSLFIKDLQMTGRPAWCSVVKNLPCNDEDAGSIRVKGRASMPENN